MIRHTGHTLTGSPETSHNMHTHNAALGPGTHSYSSHQRYQYSLRARGMVSRSPSESESPLERPRGTSRDCLRSLQSDARGGHVARSSVSCYTNKKLVVRASEARGHARGDLLLQYNEI